MEPGFSQVQDTDQDVDIKGKNIDLDPLISISHLFGETELPDDREIFGGRVCFVLDVLDM